MHANPEAAVLAGEQLDVLQVAGLAGDVAIGAAGAELNYLPAEVELPSAVVSGPQTSTNGKPTGGGTSSSTGTTKPIPTK
ncbi:MAG TPA: hypothetical protein VMR45_06305 [Patescibacteria group bacterium]|nr:hypothetical protein [Patescibacteria group bacterium]